MEILQDLIASLSPEEQRVYKLLSGRSHSKEKRQDLTLFDYTRSAGKNYDESYISKKLYPGAKNKNAIYRLKNKVKSDVQRSLNYLHFNETNRLAAYSALQLVEHYYHKENYKLCFYYLGKAEELANQSNDARLLDFIFSLALELSQVYTGFDPTAYIHKKKQNEKRLQLQNRMEEIYARLNYQIQTSFNYSSERIGGTQLLRKMLAGYKSKELKTNVAFRVKIFKTLAQAFVQQHNYKELVKYTRESMESFEQLGWFTGENEEVKLQMYVYICNGLYKLKKYFESLRYAALFKTELAKSEEFHAKYDFFYNNLLIYNYTRTEPAKAVEICDQVLQKLKRKANPQLECITLINKGIALSEVHRFDDALSTLNRVFINDYFRQSDDTFKMKILMAEIQLYYMAGDFKYCLQRLKGFTKKYKPLLLRRDYNAEAQLCEIILMMLKKQKGQSRSSKELLQKTRAFISAKTNPAQESTQIIDYKIWLQFCLRTT